MFINVDIKKLAQRSIEYLSKKMSKEITIAFNKEIEKFEERLKTVSND